MRKKSKKRAFSLVELAVVTITIGLLISGVTVGNNLVRNARLAAAKAATLSSQIASISGMVLWVEPSTSNSFSASQIADGAQLTTWYNIEPSGFLTKNNLTTSASSNVLYEATGINNVPDVNMTVAGYMATSSFSQGALATSTVVIVFKPTAAVSTTYLTISDAGSSSASTCSISIKSTLANLNAGTSADTAATTFALNNKYILMAYFNGASSKVFSNSTTELGGGGTVINAGTNPMDGITIGANKSGTSGIAAEISEVIVFNRILKDTERSDVMSYLSKKYKISVTGL